MKSARKILSALVLLGVFAFAPKTAHAAQLLNLQLSLSNSTPSLSSVYSFSFRHQTSNTLRTIKFQFCQNPSGTCADINGINTQSAGKNAITGLTNADWTVDPAVADTPMLRHLGAGELVNANLDVVVPMTAITNPTIGDCNGGLTTASSDTCYVRITSYTGDGTGTVDEGIVSFTIVANVTVSARVDPSFSFVVEGVNSNVATNGMTTSVTTLYNSIPFGNLTAGTPKYAAHALRVTTNTQTGYTVSVKLLNQMTGNYTTNNIDPFIAPWGTPTSWTEPTGSTPNDNSGWIGANTSDADVSGWSGGSNKFGVVTTAAAYTVMQGAGSDNGSTAVYVTYAIEANMFQPADTYTGVIQYNALPTY